MEENRRTLSDWLQFFLEVGIPANQAANYAVSFVENRIERSMLGDLDKDYLKELGVTVLGDVIAILKHSKKVASTAAKKAEIFRTADEVKKSPATTHMVNRLLKRDNSQQQVAKAMAVDNEEDILVKASSRVSTASRLRKSKLRSERIAQSTSSPPVARRRVAPPSTAKSLLREEVPVPKKRRVLPEHEGGYKITMPAGTIPKTAKLKAQGKLMKKSPAPAASKGVFSRLGSSQSDAKGDSLTSPHIQTVIAKAKAGKDKNISFTVTGLGKIDPQNIVSPPKGASVEDGVFGRLGESSSTRRTIKRPATSTQFDEPIAVDASPYGGVLKEGGKHKPRQTKIKLASGSADRSEFGESRLASDNVKQRLGRGQSEGVRVSRIIRTSTAPASSVRRRLGGAGDSTVSSSTDRSQSAVRVATKVSLKGGKELVGRKPVKTATVGYGGSQNVFSRLGNR